MQLKPWIARHKGRPRHSSVILPPFLVFPLAVVKMEARLSGFTYCASGFMIWGGWANIGPGAMVSAFFFESLYWAKVPIASIFLRFLPIWTGLVLALSKYRVLPGFSVW